MTDIAYQRLRNNLSRKTIQPDTVANAEIMLDAWFIVDGIHRLRGLLSQLPKLKKNRFPSLRIFQDRTKLVEDFRNRVQHMNNELNALSKQTGGAWGTVTWFTASDLNMTNLTANWVYSGSVSLYSQAGVPMPFAGQMRDLLDLITLHAYEENLSLSNMLRAVEDFTVVFEKSYITQLEELTLEHGEIPLAASDAFLKIEFEREDKLSASVTADVTSAPSL